jgi:RNA polymerase sigma-70 factor, ECF subfamily
MASKTDLYRLVNDEIPRLRRYAIFLTRDTERSEDLVQDTLLRAITHIDKWQPGTNMRSWLMTILHNTFVNDVKKHRPILTRDGNIDFSRASDGNQEIQHRIRDVQRAFDHLSHRHRQIIWLICVEQRGYSEVANILSVPVGTVRSRLCRAREHLRQWADRGTPERPTRRSVFINRAKPARTALPPSAHGHMKEMRR